MTLSWKIAAGVAAVLLLIRLIQYVKRIRRSIARNNVVEKRIKAEQIEIRGMRLEEVEPLGRQVLSEKATLEAWAGPVPANVNHVLAKLDGSIQSLFRTYSKIFFEETGTEFNARYLLTTAPIDGAYQLALDANIHHTLIARPGSPRIIELNENDCVVEEYPGIFHYFLLAERE